MDFNPKKPDFSIKSVENSNLFQRRILHADNSHNYDFVGFEDEKELKTHKSNTNTPKSTDNNNLSSTWQTKKNLIGDGSDQKSSVSSKMDTSMGKSVKFEIRSGSVSLCKIFQLIFSESRANICFIKK